MHDQRRSLLRHHETAEVRSETDAKENADLHRGRLAERGGDIHPAPGDPRQRTRHRHLQGVRSLPKLLVPDTRNSGLVLHPAHRHDGRLLEDLQGGQEDHERGEKVPDLHEPAAVAGSGELRGRLGVEEQPPLEDRGRGGHSDDREVRGEERVREREGVDLQGEQQRAAAVLALSAIYVTHGARDDEGDVHVPLGFGRGEFAQVRDVRPFFFFNALHYPCLQMDYVHEDEITSSSL